jgi:hypothetical protein
MLDGPRHAQMDEEVPPARELDNQILAASSDRSDLLALERGRHGFGRLGPGQPRVDDLDALEAPAHEPWLEMRPDRLHLG